MLDTYEPSLPAMVMTQARRKRLAVWGSAALVVAGASLFVFGAGAVLWGCWAVSAGFVAGRVLLQPSIQLEPQSPDEILTDFEYKKTKKYMKALEKADFSALDDLDPSDEELSVSQS